MPTKYHYRAIASALLAACIVPAHAADWLIGQDSEQVGPGQQVQLEVVKPTALGTWPESLSVTIVGARGERQEVRLKATGTITPDGARRGYLGIFPAMADGLVTVALADGLNSNRLALVVSHNEVVVKETPLPVLTAPVSNQTIAFPDQPALSDNEPTYIVAGYNGGTTARFQLSFKYRFLDPQSSPAQLFPWLRYLHFGYTQTSLWDLSANSSPFKDTSYRPTLFWEGRLDQDQLAQRFALSGLRAGLEHESNGKDGDSSRSINLAFAQPVWHKKLEDGSLLSFMPKFYDYIGTSDNPDIQRYRGYVDWVARYGRDDGWVAQAMVRAGTGGHGTVQLDLSYPLTQQIFARTGGFFYLQYFNGYGDTLLDYNVRTHQQLRAGFALVR